MRRMKKARQYLLSIFAALLLCGIFSVNTVKADTQYVYDNASLLSDEEEQDLERSCAEFESNTDIHMVILTLYLFAIHSYVSCSAARICSSVGSAIVLCASIAPAITS